MRLVCAVIIAAVAISTLIDAAAEWELRQELADRQAWWPLLREGGTMCGHDYWAADPGVMDAVQQQFGGRHQVAANTRIWWVRK